MATHPVMNTQKPLGLSLNRESAAILLKGLEGLPAEDRKTVLFDKLKSDLNAIIVIWDRRIKNEKIIQERKRAKFNDNLKQQADKRQANRRVLPRHSSEQTPEQHSDNS